MFDIFDELEVKGKISIIMSTYNEVYYVNVSIGTCWFIEKGSKNC